MRICFYTEEAPPRLGGQAVVVDSLACQFLARGHEVMVLAPWPRRSAKPIPDATPYPVMRHPRFLSKRWFLSAYRWWVAAAHRRHRFDLLHCHSIYPTGYIAARCPTLAGVPLVVTSHGDVSSERFARQAGLPERYRLTLERADATIAISHFIEQRFKELCPAIRRIDRISNGVNALEYALPALRPPDLPAPIRPHEYLLFVGRLVEQKGVDLLLEAFARATQPPVHLVVAGAGSARVELEALATRLATSDRVHFLGVAEGEAKRYLYQNALCTVMPSRSFEGFGLVALESLAAGRPVVGSDIPGLREVIADGRTGILTPPDSAEGLAQTLSRVLAKRHWLNRLGEEGRRVAANYGWDRVAERHLEVYRELCHGLRRAA